MHQIISSDHIKNSSTDLTIMDVWFITLWLKQKIYKPQCNNRRRNTSEHTRLLSLMKTITKIQTSTYIFFSINRNKNRAWMFNGNMQIYKWCDLISDLIFKYMITSVKKKKNIQWNKAAVIQYMQNNQSRCSFSDKVSLKCVTLDYKWYFN